MHIAIILIILLLLATQAAGEPFQVPLKVGTLFVPDNCHPVNGKVDLVVHFHGSPERMRQCLIESKKNVALVTVSYNGLSNVYTQPFVEDTMLFGKIIDEARTRLARHFFREKSIDIGRIVVTSFSAGFGAVREILKDPAYVGAISDLIMADSLYAGYVEEDGKNVVNPENMVSFEPIVRRATGGKSNVWLTYSEVVPGTYASTFETAEYLANKVGAKIEPASGTDATGMKLIGKADLKGFHVRGYAGNDGPAHMRHLLSIGVFLSWTALKG